MVRQGVAPCMEVSQSIGRKSPIDLGVVPVALLHFGGFGPWRLQCRGLSHVPSAWWCFLLGAEERVRRRVHVEPDP